jgi:hypothetical protein
VAELVIAICVDNDNLQHIIEENTVPAPLTTLRHTPAVERDAVTGVWAERGYHEAAAALRDDALRRSCPGPLDPPCDSSRRRRGRPARREHRCSLFERA